MFSFLSFPIHLFGGESDSFPLLFNRYGCLLFVWSQADELNTLPRITLLRLSGSLEPFRGAGLLLYPLSRVFRVVAIARRSPLIRQPADLIEGTKGARSCRRLGNASRSPLQNRSTEH